MRTCRERGSLRTGGAGGDPWRRGCRGREEHLLVVSLHAEEDEVGCGTSQAALQVGAAPNLLSLCVEAVEGLHRLFKELPFNLEGERDRESGQGQPPQSVESHRLGGSSGGATAEVGQHAGKTREPVGAHRAKGTGLAVRRPGVQSRLGCQLAM